MIPTAHPFSQLVDQLGPHCRGAFTTDDPGFLPTPEDAEKALAHLPVEERRLVAGAVPQRQWDFAQARRLAHTLLRQVGHPTVLVLRDDQRAPLWPMGLCGSLTHTTGFQGAVISTDPTLAGLGVDAEIAQPLPTGVLETIASPLEHNHLSKLPAQLPLETVLFSAKESLYKAWYPATGRWLGFEDANVSLGVESVTVSGSDLRGHGYFQATVKSAVLEELPDTHSAQLLAEPCCGYWRVGAGLVVTAFLFPAAR